MTFGSLFSGIGGIDLGLERAGLVCKWQIEKDDYARAILQRHWPEVPKYRDVRYFLRGKRWRRCRAAWHVDMLAGGFPCQDVSNAGKRAGIDGKRSGLWSEFARIIRLLRPRYVLVENVDALAVRGLDRVLGDLVSLGFDCEWDRIPAAAVGAPHLRWRIFIVAYASGESAHQQHWRRPGTCGEGAVQSCGDGEVRVVSDRRESGVARGSIRETHVWRNQDAADANSEGQQQPEGGEFNQWRRSGDCSGQDVSHTPSIWSGQRWRDQFAAYCEEQRDLYWPDPEPWLRRVDDGLTPTLDGVANRVARLTCLGNAVLPQITEYIGRRILEADNGRH